MESKWEGARETTGGGFPARFLCTLSPTSDPPANTVKVARKRPRSGESKIHGIIRPESIFLQMIFLVGIMLGGLTFIFEELLTIRKFGFQNLRIHLFSSADRNTA